MASISKEAENGTDIIAIEKNTSGNQDSTYIPGTPEEAQLLRKCDLHIIPVLFVMYLLSFLDRINIGNAKIQGLQKELHMSGSQYNVALLIFFVPYILLEVCTVRRWILFNPMIMCSDDEFERCPAISS